MQHRSEEKENIKLSVPKLIALWAFSECALGGILHAFQFPFSGLLLAGFAVTIICIIGYTSDTPGSDILYGTLVAISVKLALSPHSPVTAYVAVGFQGLLGAGLFYFQKHKKVAYMLFGAIALFESAVQKVLTLTIIFGNALWNSIDITANQLVKTFGGTEDFRYSILLLCVYSLIYILWGGVIGLWAYKLPSRIKNVDRNAVELYANSNINSSLKKSSGFWVLIICFLIIMCAYVYILGASSDHIIWTIARPFIIIAAWYFLLHPLCMWLIRKFVKRQGGNISKAVESIKKQIPDLRRLTQQVAGYTSVNYNGVKRIQYFIIILILLACEERDHSEG